jgi:acyl-CoA thioesterase-2
VALGVGELVGGLLPLLNLDAVDVGVLHAAPGRPDIPRGIIGSQSLVAAGHTVDTDRRWVDSLHLRHHAVCDANRVVEYRVDVVRDSEALSTRTVKAVQGDALLATMVVSFHVPRRGRVPRHQPLGTDDWPDPHSLPATEAGAALDVRCVDRMPWHSVGPTPANRFWLRVTEEIPDRILLHAAALVYAADLLLGRPLVNTARATADLSIRLHRGFRADDWMRHEHEVSTVAPNRAVTTGRFFSSMGRPVASVSQKTVDVSIRAEDEKSSVVNGPDNGSREE